MGVMSELGSGSWRSESASGASLLEWLEGNGQGHLRKLGSGAERTGVTGDIV